MVNRHASEAQEFAHELFYKLVDMHPEGIFVPNPDSIMTGVRIAPETIGLFDDAQLVDFYNVMSQKQKDELGVDSLLPVLKEGFIDEIDRKETRAQDEVYKAMNERLREQFRNVLEKKGGAIRIASFTDSPDGIEVTSSKSFSDEKVDFLHVDSEGVISAHSYGKSSFNFEPVSAFKDVSDERLREIYDALSPDKLEGLGFDADFIREYAGETAEKRPIDEMFGLSGEPGEEVYGLAFDRAQTYLDDIAAKMSAAVGWKDPGRHYDFEGFSGYFLDIQDDHVDVRRGEETVAVFRGMPDGRLGFEGLGEPFNSYPEDINPWYPLSDLMEGKHILEPENIEAAKKETHGGQEIIYGLRFGEDAAFMCEDADKKLRSALVERDANIRLVDSERFLGGFQRWIEKDARPGFEGEVRPEMIRYAWDGQTLRTERDIDLSEGQRKDWMQDWEMIGALREGGEKIRAELEKAAGVEGGTHFKFENALYPNLSLRDDALFLTNSCGRGMADFVTVVNGEVGLYRGYDPEKPLSEARKTFSGVREALDSVRKAILGERNVLAAKKDFEAFKQSMGKDRGRHI